MNRKYDRPVRYKNKAGKVVTYFIKGPLPMWWLREAAKLGGSALDVGVMLWFKHGINKDRPFTISNWEATLSGSSSYTGRRGLHALAKANLIELTENSGGKSTITMITVQPGE